MVIWPLAPPSPFSWQQQLTAAFYSFATSPIVTVLVGPKRKVYSFHKDLLVERCPFFEKCLKDSYKEGRENQVYLAEESPAVFDRFATFIYHNRVDEIVTFPDNSLAVRAFALADKFCMPRFQNALIDAIACFHKKHTVFVPDLDFINDHVLLNSKIKAFLIDQLIYDIARSKDIDQTDLTGKEVSRIIRGGGDLATEIFWAVRNIARRDDWPSHWRNRCNYHNHETDDKRECYRKREDAEGSD
jgi:BTB/POZ domain